MITGAGLTAEDDRGGASQPTDFRVDSDNRPTATLPETNAPGSVAVVIKTAAGAASHTFQLRRLSGGQQVTRALPRAPGRRVSGSSHRSNHSQQPTLAHPSCPRA